MAKRVLICLSHSIEEYDQLKILHSLGYEVASIGGYIDPAHPHDPKRPALPNVPCVATVKDAIDALGTDDNLGAAQSRVPEAVLEWLGVDGVIFFHHYLRRLFDQWEHLAEWRAAGGRAIWRTTGQSTADNEAEALPYRRDGLEIVRYSPRERNIPGYAGQDALIRFYKDTDEWYGWHGGGGYIANVTQGMRRRHPWTNADFYLEATKGLPALPAGPGSGDLPDGQGELKYDDMREYLRAAGCYLYTGTQPASYTLGLLEALVTGVPTVSIGRSHMTIFPYGPDLFEGADICSPFATDDPLEARRWLRGLLEKPETATHISQHQRHRAILEFGYGPVARAWRGYLGAP